MAKSFVHLHLHTQYSLLDGAIQLPSLFAPGPGPGHAAVAMTDHGNLFGAIEFSERARESGVAPLIGCEAYLASGSRFEHERHERHAQGTDAINHQLLIAMNETGYRNLVYLISMGYLQGFYYKPRIDLELLRARSEGLIATSGCLSSLIPRAIVEGKRQRARELAAEFAAIFPGRYYLELQRHGIPAQDTVNAELAAIAAETGLPLVATNDAHYLEAGDAGSHDALLCIGTASNLADANRFRFDGEGFYVKDGDEMRELFHDHPEAVERTLEIAERCPLEIETGRYQLPEYQVPAGQSREAVLAANAWRGVRQRLGLAPDEPFPARLRDYEARVRHELGVIQSMGFAGYFLIVADFVDYARREGIPVGPGRGSAAGSLVAYGLGITGIDPLEYGIIFERFLNPERVSMPDIDIDFCMRGRDRVIRYVADKYGGAEPNRPEQMRVAHIATFGTLQARAAIRDVGRALGMSYSDVDRIAKLVPETLGITLEQALAREPELRARSAADPQVAQLLDTARRLEGLTRHASRHAAGLVIGNRPLIESVPLYRDPKSGDVMTQYDMRSVEKIGLVKFDFLGLKTLTALADAERLVRETRDGGFRLEAIPLDDAASYALLANGNTEGVFQVESSGLTDLVVKLAPRNFTELIPIMALYRPGPLGSGMVDDYVGRKRGDKPVEYLLPELEELTSETLGVIVYQDQVLQIAHQLAGYSLGEADLLRRAMSKKKPEEMALQRERFVAGAEERGIAPSQAAGVFDLIQEFAGYGFAKSHSAAYALITYQTAYLKTHYTREYLAALMTVEAGNHDRLARMIAQADDRGFAILPPDVNESGRDFGVVAEGIRFGLSGIKNVGQGAVEAILEARREGGGFADLFDFCRRVDAQCANRRTLESLVACGAFDSLHPNRAAVMESLGPALDRGAAARRDREVGQQSLFGEAAGNGATPGGERLAEAPPWPAAKQLADEKELLGCYVTGHPLGAFSHRLRSACTSSSATGPELDGREIRAGGLLTGLRESRTRRGETMAFGVLEDLEGSYDLIFFPDGYGRLRGLLRAARSPEAGRPALPLLCIGKLEAGTPPKLVVRSAAVWGGEAAPAARRLRLALRDAEAAPTRLAALRDLLRKYPGRCPIELILRAPGEAETTIALPDSACVDASEECLRDLNDLFERSVTALELGDLAEEPW